MATDLQADWGVIVAKPQKTEQVAESLTSQAIDYFIPLEQVLSVRGGKHRRYNRPMLGRYVLYAVNEFWRSIFNMRGVSGLLLVTDYESEIARPAVVDPRQLASLRDQCINGVYQKPEVPRKGFTYGQKVTPNHGPLAFHVGKYDGVVKDHREAAIFQLFGRDQRLIFKAGVLQPCS